MPSDKNFIVRLDYHAIAEVIRTNFTNPIGKVYFCHSIFRKRIINRSVSVITNH